MAGRRLFSCRRGVVAVEMALVAPVLVMFILVLADFGLAANERIKLSGAARAGAQAAMTDPANTARITQAVQQAAAALPSSGLAVTVTTACGCADGSTITCGGTCATGLPRDYVTVRVAETYALLLTYPGVGSSVNLTGQATLRY